MGSGTIEFRPKTREDFSSIQDYRFKLRPFWKLTIRKAARTPAVQLTENETEGSLWCRYLHLLRIYLRSAGEGGCRLRRVPSVDPLDMVTKLSAEGHH